MRQILPLAGTSHPQMRLRVANLLQLTIFYIGMSLRVWPERLKSEYSLQWHLGFHEAGRWADFSYEVTNCFCHPRDKWFICRRHQAFTGLQLFHRLLQYLLGSGMIDCGVQLRCGCVLWRRFECWSLKTFTQDFNLASFETLLNDKLQKKQQEGIKGRLCMYINGNKQCYMHCYGFWSRLRPEWMTELPALSPFVLAYFNISSCTECGTSYVPEITINSVCPYHK